MVKEIIELMMGRGGRFLLDVYNEYHLIVNVFIILYGLVLIWAHINLRRLVHQMDRMILDIAAGSGATPDPAVIFDYFSSRWQSFLGERRTFIPSRNDLWITRVAGQDLIKILGLQPDYVRVVLAKAQVLEAGDTSSKRTFRAWELYRHQLLIGVRARHLEPDFQMKMRAKNSLAQQEAQRSPQEIKS